MGTINMIANMMGLGPLLETASSPDFQQYAQSIIGAILATNQRCERIERQLALVCQAMGISDAGAVEYLPAVRSALPQQQRSAGPAGNPVTGGTTDDGASPAAARDGLGDALADYAQSAGVEFDLDAWMRGQTGLPPHG